MRKNIVIIVTLAFLVALPGMAYRALAQAGQIAYPAMAPFNRYLIADKNAEIALARSAAPASIADAATVMVLGRDGYTTAMKGTNGFMCLVERGWGASTDNSEFWNAKVRSPLCFNAAATSTFAVIYLMKTRLAMEGKSKKEIVEATDAAFKNGTLPEVAPGAMCYMMSKQQYLNDEGKSWHPHLMFFVSGYAAKIWGANLHGSPVIAANDPEEHATIMMVWLGEWSDGTPGTPLKY